MKPQTILTCLALAALSLASCSDDFLENKPQGSLSDGVMQSTKAIELLCTGAYADLRGSMWKPTSNWTFSEVRSDNAYKGGGGTGDGGHAHQMEIFDVHEDLGNLDEQWYQLYCDISRCNAALRALRAADEQQVPVRDVRIAEMRMLRAHYFFELSRLFNKVPYFDENVATPDIVRVPNDQYSREQMLDLIAGEMTEAADALPATQPQVGRWNKYSALAYAAKVKLYRAYEQDPSTHKVVRVNPDALSDVISLTGQVIGSHKYSLLPDFQDLDLVQNDNGPESVFAVQYSMNDGSDGAGRYNESNLLNSPGGNSPYHGDGFFLPSQDLINAYQTDASGLPEFQYQQLPDYGVVDFQDDDHQTLSGVEHSVDPRLDFVCGRPTITWKTWTQTPCQSWVRDRGTYGHNCIKRFWVSPESPDMFQGWPWGASAMNWQLIRYADVLLWRAEALIEQGTNLEEARGLINQIRQRTMQSAPVRDFNDPQRTAANYHIALYPQAGWTQQYARQALRTETRLETAFEGDRYYDLVRWGIVDQVMPAYISAESDNRVYYQSAHFTAGRDEYFPVPVNQYRFSQGLYTQNPGFPKFGE